ncbi:MAG TPA: membrane protein insertion efficiency factor YidD [Vicinamibacterales bacterium]|nr:membrane protein insertion efficiency factor YidD [Vicinamibacterales bacterium]
MHRSQVSKLNTPRFSAGAAIALALLRAYKIGLSPLFTGSCRFYPSCADYMSEAIQVHGTAKGIWLGTRRLARCHPLGSHGVDPVPRP